MSILTIDPKRTLFVPGDNNIYCGDTNIGYSERSRRRGGEEVCQAPRPVRLDWEDLRDTTSEAPQRRDTVRVPSITESQYNTLIDAVLGDDTDNARIAIGEELFDRLSTHSDEIDASLIENIHDNREATKAIIDQLLRLSGITVVSVGYDGIQNPITYSIPDPTYTHVYDSGQAGEAHGNG